MKNVWLLKKIALTLLMASAIAPLNAMDGDEDYDLEIDTKMVAAQMATPRRAFSDMLKGYLVPLLHGDLIPTVVSYASGDKMHNVVHRDDQGNYVITTGVPCSDVRLGKLEFSMDKDNADNLASFFGFLGERISDYVRGYHTKLLTDTSRKPYKNPGGLELPVVLQALDIAVLECGRTPDRSALESVVRYYPHPKVINRLLSYGAKVTDDNGNSASIIDRIPKGHTFEQEVREILKRQAAQEEYDRKKALAISAAGSVRDRAGVAVQSASSAVSAVGGAASSMSSSAASAAGAVVQSAKTSAGSLLEAAREMTLRDVSSAASNAVFNAASAVMSRFSKNNLG